MSRPRIKTMIVLNQLKQGPVSLEDLVILLYGIVDKRTRDLTKYHIYQVNKKLKDEIAIYIHGIYELIQKKTEGEI